MQIVEVIWDDAFSSSGELSMEEAKKSKPIRTHTLAYLMAENDHGITMCTDMYPEDPKTCAHINFIPWGMVVEYWEYE